MPDSPCPFCEPDPSRIIFDSGLVFGVWDAFAVSNGHALVVTRRHVASWFDATPSEQAALTGGIATAREAVQRTHAPAGFNIGINVGEAAGQTIPHLHVHVIPRYLGDVPDPRGGVRHVIPGRGNYLVSPTSVGPSDKRLVTGGEDPLLPHIVSALATADRADIVVSFVLESGLDRVFEHLKDLLDRGGRLRILTGDYLGITEPDALMRLLDLEGNVVRRVYETGSASAPASVPMVRSFHPKAYIFGSGAEGVAFVGSSNLSAAALTSAVEWNYRVVPSRDRGGFGEIGAAFETLFRHPSTMELLPDWIERYRARRVIQRPIVEAADLEPEPPRPPVEPNEVQAAALEALQATRTAGNHAGLVVLATGLGKTWLSAFDTSRPEFKRVLFVAHREEILNQAHATFRRIRPGANLGHFTGEKKQATADVLFASIQTLSRREHLEQFAPASFDYIVIDEFHHASAASYRKLIGYFNPKFLLGLTATPERSDGGDLLALCQQNLVYRCDLVEGVRRALLSPFRYFGVPDDVDYANIPWRSTRFDEEALTTAVATQRRAANALEQFRSHAAKRALGFCVSMRHADFMSAFFTSQGIRSVAVHSGPTSAPRALSLEQLEKGELEIVFAVDMFNEGVDLPTLDTVMMLRPTESKILWLQQFGRGLRRAPGKERLTVIDYIGNHRVFLLKPQTLFNLPPGDREVFNLIERLQNGTQELPPGCEVTYELEAVDILRSLLRRTATQDEALQRYYEDFRTVHGVRPTAVEAYHDGYNPRSVRERSGSWTQFVATMGDLTAEQLHVLELHEGFIASLDTTEMVKSYKMLVLLAMINADRFPGSIAIDELASEVERLATRTTRAGADLGQALGDRPALIRLLEQNPVAAWAGGRGTGGVSYFAYDSGTFKTTFNAGSAASGAVQELARELAEWRLAEYLDRVHRDKADFTTLKVSHSGGSPILFLPSGAERADLPNGWTSVLIDGETYQANFVKIAVNVVRKAGDDTNQLPRILRGWFGADAGAPGTGHAVSLQLKGADWHLSAFGRRRGEVKLWQSYSREEIPGLFGLEFSTAIWNAGFVTRPGHIFLLVTLDKSGHAKDFKYHDRFISPTDFEWQSQNRTSQESAVGRAIRDHAGLTTAVHLFVRSEKKRPDGRSAPFVYCGDVRFMSWEGEKPITVRWRLSAPVPETMWKTIRNEH